MCSKSNCLCLIMSAKVFWLCHVLTYFSFIDNLAHNATRLSLLNRIFFFNDIMYDSLHIYTTTSYKHNALRIIGQTLIIYQSIKIKVHLIIFWCVSLSLKNYVWSHVFIKVYGKVKVLVQKQKSNWCLF